MGVVLTLQATALWVAVFHCLCMAVYLKDTELQRLPYQGGAQGCVHGPFQHVLASALDAQLYSTGRQCTRRPICRQARTHAGYRC